MLTSLKLWTNKPIIGIGAFNLIRHKVFKKIQATKSLRLTPIEDLTLAKCVIKNGYRSQFAFGDKFISLLWYDSLKNAAIGFEKNLFAFFEFSIFKSTLALTALLFFIILPWLSILGDNPFCLAAGITNYLLTAYTLFICNKKQPLNLLYYLTYPIGASITFFISIRSVVLSVLRGGMYWGNQFYTNEKLKAFQKKHIK